MCNVYASILFDFSFPTPILLLRSHIAVSGSSAMWELRNLILSPKRPRTTRRGLFFTRPHPIRICPVGAIGQTSCVSMLDQTPAPLWGGDVCFSRGELFVFFFLCFFLTCFFPLSFLLSSTHFQLLVRVRNVQIKCLSSKLLDVFHIFNKLLRCKFRRFAWYLHYLTGAWVSQFRV